MIDLGNVDPEVQPATIAAYLDAVRKATRQDWGHRLRGEETKAWKPLEPSKDANELKIAEVQQILRDAEIFPGGKVDGICGYRTRSAIRLFQEYVRTIEKDQSSIPTGVVDAKCFAHLKRWRDSHLKADWADAFQAWMGGFAAGGQSEYQTWLAFLNDVKRSRLTTPGRMLQMVKDFQEPSDTLKVKDWDFDPRHIHVIGVRRKGQTTSAATFDDVLVLLVMGLVFKFQGSTDPGNTKSAAGAPFLVLGQHKYHFGWHLLSESDSTYQALKPLSSLNPVPSGVLVVRSKGDYVLTDADLDNGVETCATINVHWGGEGGSREVKNWSEGCQVITGFGYFNHHNQPIRCTAFTAINSGTLGNGKTRGAYNVFADVVAAFSSDLGSEVRYTLLAEEDLALSPEISATLESARTAARAQFGK